MKFRKDKDILKLFGFSLSAILIGILVMLFIPIATVGLISISSGLLGFIIGLRLASKPRDYFLQDERTVRLREKAGYYAYEIMASVAVVIMVLNIVKLSPSLTSDWYFSKKGE